jgi:hypothetical protein
MTKCKTYTAAELSGKYGCTPRYWTRLAASGKLPGARQCAGPRGKWLFDADEFEQWWRQSKVGQWPECSVEAKHIGLVPSVTTEKSGEASRRRTEKLLNDVLGSGSTS